MRFDRRPDQITSDPWEAGTMAIDEGRWSDAIASFAQVLDESGDSGRAAEAWEGTGLAAFWLEDAPAAVEAHERAFSAYQSRGEPAAAARMALWLSDDHLSLMSSPAAANGWLEKATRLVELSGQTAEWAWLPVYRGHYALQVQHDVAKAVELAREGLKRARAIDVPEVEVVALALDGLGLVLGGDIDAGLQRLDEASATAVTRGTENLNAVAWALCYQIQGCDSIRDFARASEWCERVLDFCERWGLRPIFSSCRIRYASVLTWQGRWADAEAQVDHLIAGTGDGREPSSGPSRRTGLIRLADIRRRQGRLDEAESLFEQGGEHRWALLGRAAVALDRGQFDQATDLSARVLRGVPPEAVTERADALLIRVRALARSGEHAAAEDLLGELRAAAERVATEPMLAAVAHAMGFVALAKGNAGAALAAFEDALAHYDRGGAPHEAASVRLELARVLRALGRDATARREAARARDRFEALGAAADLSRADQFLGQHAPADGTGSPLGNPPLSKREVEVLRLVGRGLSNPEIAKELFLSPHTVKRHIGNILRKLGCTTRAAAVAEASRKGAL